MVPVISYTACVGCEACVDLFPGMIEMRDDKAWLTDERELTEDECGALRTICPASAIECE